MSNKSPQLGWGHVNINVRDLDKAINFYQLLGFTVMIRGVPYLGLDSECPPLPLPDDMATAIGVTRGTRGRSVIMQLDDGFPKIDLTEFAEIEQTAPLQNCDLGLVRICLLTQDLRGDIAYLKAHGVEFISDLKVAHGELADIAVCQDPDGTLIELLQAYLDRPWTLPSRG